MMDAQAQLKERVAHAHRRARALQRPVLASYTWEIPTFETFTIIQHTHISHYYFITPDREEEVFGCGNALAISGQGPDRFRKIESEWAMYGNDVDDDLYAFSGFSFNPQIRTEKWAAFGEASLVVPTFLYRRNGDVCTLSVTVAVRPNDSVDHVLANLTEQWTHLSNPVQMDDLKPTSYRLESSGSASFEDSFRDAKARIVSGELKKLVISREVLYEIEGGSFPFAHALNNLVTNQVGSYVYLYRPQHGTGYFGATPERLVQKDGCSVRTAAIAGTIKRLDDQGAQQQARRMLLTDEKNLEEHDIVVQDITEALKPYTDTLHVPPGPSILENRSVFHLHTPIQATTHSHVSLLNLAQALHPTPALGGSPKRAAVEALYDVEAFERGWYGSPFGWLNNRGDGEYVVAIRSALVDERQLTLYAGCGIVRDSELQAELEETETKLNPMKQAIGLTEQTMGDVKI